MRGLLTLLPLFSDFSDYFSRDVDNQRIYWGEWKYNTITGVCTGNPINSPQVRDHMKSFKRRFRAEDATRTHSVAMSVQHMEKIFNNINIRLEALPSVEDEQTYHRTERTKCLYFRAFASCGWTLMTRFALLIIHCILLTNNMTFRNFETSKLQVRHIDLDCCTQDAEKLPYIRVNLTERKGWQNHAEKNEGVVRGNICRTSI